MYLYADNLFIKGHLQDRQSATGGAFTGTTTLGPSASKDGCGRWLVVRYPLTMPAFSLMVELNSSSGNFSETLFNGVLIC